MRTPILSVFLILAVPLSACDQIGTTGIVASPCPGGICGPTGSTGATTNLPTKAPPACQAMPANALSFANGKLKVDIASFGRTRTDEQLIVASTDASGGKVIGSVVNETSSFEFPFTDSPSGLKFRATFVFGQSRECFDSEAQP